ncbi:MAG TPA: ABC transporter permease [Bryobacteraceae bacterium]|nr:ABC transporter permease [Bryobacteraceae bacterium]
MIDSVARLRDGLLQDLRYTLRTLRRDAGFTLFATLIAGLGIGAASTVFSVVNTLLLRPLPFLDPDRIAWVSNHEGGGLSDQTTQVGHLLDLRAQDRSFSDLAAYFAFFGVGDNQLTGQGEPERLTGVQVSQNFFPLLGVQPMLGRGFRDEECKWHGPRAVLLTHALWERRFASDPSIVGRPLTLDAQPVTVVGVLPPSFDFASVFSPGSHVDLFSPFPLTEETNRWGNTLAIIGRLKPGVTAGSADAELKVLAAQLTRTHPERNGFDGNVSLLQDHVRGRIRPALLVLACAVGVVMLIVCANLSNLLLARSAARQREIAIRTALGAGRARLIRQALTESVVLAGAGAALGLVLAALGTFAISHLQAISIPLLSSVRLDATVVAFTALMAMASGLIFGLAPALYVPASGVHDALKDSTRGASDNSKRGWIRSTLVVSEIAFACVLLVAAALLMRSFLRVLDVNLGFNPEHTASVRVDPSRRFNSQAESNAYYDEVLRRVRSVPGIQTAGLTDALPLGRNRSWGAGAKGVVYPPGHYPDAFVRIVSDGYTRAMGIPLRAGRDISEQDGPSADPVIVVNETMARTLWPGQNALGQLVRGGRSDLRVIGIVGDVRHLALERGAGLEMYIPMRQTGDFQSVDLVVRTSLAPADLASAIRAALTPIEPNVAGNEFRTIQQLVDKAVSPRRFVSLLLSGFAVFAVILALLGIFGLISYSVNQRTQEIGIRMALGESAGRLQTRILRETLSLAGIGMLIGSAASWAVARTLGGFLFGITASDPATFLGMLATLTLAALIGGYLPARRASRIDPMIALRSN